MVGTNGFEPSTARPPVVCATRLRYAPIKRILQYLNNKFKLKIVRDI